MVAGDDYLMNGYAIAWCVAENRQTVSQVNRLILGTRFRPKRPMAILGLGTALRIRLASGYDWHLFVACWKFCAVPESVETVRLENPLFD